MSILIEKFKLTIDGKNYDEQYIYSHIRLSQQLLQPNELRFCMEKNTLVEEESDMKINLSGALLGKELTLTLTTYREDESRTGYSDTLRFSGIVFGVNALRGRMGDNPEIEVTAYSHDYLLRDNAHCFSYENTDLKRLVSETASGCGDIPLSNNPVMTEDIPYAVQYNETDYEFLSRLARRYGEWFYNDGTQTVFGKLEKRDSVLLVPNFDIDNFQYRMDMSSLKFTHGRHDYLDYRNTQGQASASTSPSLHRLTDYTYNAAEEVYKKETFRNLHASTAEENGLDEVEYSTKSEGLGRKTGMMTLSGTTNRADLTIGSLIKIREYYDDGTGDEQEYTHDEMLIVGITHFGENCGSYENKFIAVPADAEYPPYAFGDLYPKAEPQRAVVKDNKDPEQLGRVRVQFHWQEEQDDSLLTPWIRIAQPHGGGDKGFYFIPEIEEEVMVGFENGNAEKPYVIGTLYHGKAKPPGSWYNDEDNIKAIRTRSGHTIEFHDTEGEEFIKIYDNEKDNFILTFSTYEQLIKLESANNIELYAKNDIIMKAGNNIETEAGKDIYETAGENNLIKVGKNRTIEVVNDISETAGDNNIIDIGKDRSIRVGDNNLAEIGKNRTIKVANNIDETAGDNISVKAGSDIKESAGSNVKIDAGTDIDASAGSNIGIKASQNISSSARQNFTASASKDLSLSASDDVTIGSGKEMNVSSGKGMDMTVGKTMKTKVRENYYIDISKKSNFKANSIEQTSEKDMTIKAGSKLEQKARSGMKIDGGPKVEVKGTNAKFN